MVLPEQRLSRFMAEFGPQRDVESRRVLSELRQRLFTRGDGPRVSRFERLERVGHGGMGVVYRAWDPVLKRRIAIKVLHPKTPDSARILDEARTLATLSHPNIVGVLDVGREGHELFVVMEYVAGETLGDVLTRRPSPSELLPLLHQVATGLSAAHAQGVVHHDIKPSNILITPGGTVRIADFGLARLLQGAQEGRPVGGTRGFAAPEQLRGGAADARSDIYSLTAIVHCAWFGEPPRLDASMAESPLPALPAAPERLKRFLRRGLAVDPEQRHATAEQWWEGLKRAFRRPLWSSLPWLGAAAAVAAGLAVFSGSEQPAMPCDPEAGQEQFWSPKRSSEVEARFVATELAFARDTFERVDARLQALSTTWSDARHEACEMGEPAVVACLDAKRSGLEVFASWVGDVKPDQLQHVTEALRTLPEPSECGAETASRTPTEQLRVLDDVLAEAEALVGAGRYVEALERLDTVELPVGTRTHARRLAMHALLRARASKLSGGHREAASELEKAYLLGLLGEREQLSAEAAALLAGLYASELATPLAAGRWIRNARVALARAPLSRIVRGRVVLGIAAAQYALGNLDGAAESLAEVDAVLPSDDPHRADLGTVLAGVRYQRGEIEEAIEAQQQALDVGMRIFGEHHPRLVAPMNNLAILFEERGQTERAQAAFERALKLSEESLGPGHVQTAMLRLGLASHGLGRRDPEACIALFERGIADLEAAVGSEHPLLNVGLQGLATALQMASRIDDAERVILRALDIAKQQQSLDARARAGIFSTYASILREQGRYDVALDAAHEALSVLLDSLGPNHPNVATVRVEIAKLHDARGESALARAELNAAVQIRREALGPEHPDVERLEALLEADSAPP